MKPEEGEAWGAGVRMCAHPERVLPFPTASLLLCQLFNLHPRPGALIPSPPDPTPLHRADQATKQGSTVKGVASGVCQTWIKIPTPLLTKRAALGNVLDLLASGSPSGKGHGTH